MIKWEYDLAKVTKAGLGGPSLSEEVKKLGGSGWELVTLLASGHGVFKRPYRNCPECSKVHDPGATHCASCGSPLLPGAGG